MDEEEESGIKDLIIEDLIDLIIIRVIKDNLAIEPEEEDLNQEEDIDIK